MEENGAAGGQRKQRGHQLGLSRVRLDVPRGAAAQRKGPGSTRLVLWLVGSGTVGPAEAGSRARPGTEAGLRREQLQPCALLWTPASPQVALS